MPPSKGERGGSEGTANRSWRVPRSHADGFLCVERCGVRDRAQEGDGGRLGSRWMNPVERGEGSPAWVQVAPTELVLKPGQSGETACAPL